MTRPIVQRYLDPLEAIWRVAAQRIGLRVERTADVFAASDGAGTLWIGTRETLDADDSVAQIVLHELCHALVEGEASLGRPDWGLDNRTARDTPREHACLRVQAHLAAGHGLRAFLAPTTEHRPYYDALPADPLAGDEPAAGAAHAAADRAERPPFAPHLAEALAATAAIVRVVREHGRGTGIGGAPLLYEVG